MNRRSLTAHPSTPPGAVRRIEVLVRRSPAGLELRYEVEGDVGRVLIPPARAPRRADELWQHTCFEAFVGESGSPAYREFNLSPSGE